MAPFKGVDDYTVYCTIHHVQLYTRRTRHSGGTGRGCR